MEDEGVYILDEPENSLSPEMQYNLSQLILYMARYNNSQISWRRILRFYWVSREQEFIILMNDPSKCANLRSWNRCDFTMIFCVNG